MGRILKRVPLDFNHPIGYRWDGYCPDIETFQKLFAQKYPFLNDYKNCSDICQNCEINCGECSEGADYCFWYNEDNKEMWFKEVPKGEAYQLWENTTEGSPVSPVFKTLDELCEWCAENATVFANIKVTKEEWKKMLDDDDVHYQNGNITFI